MRFGCIIQARLGSSRFPNKALADLNGKPVLQHVIERAGEILGANKVVLATPDQELQKLFRDKVETFIGPEDDVLERYLLCAEVHRFDPIMRITGDCPLLRPDLCRKVLNLYHSGGCAMAAIGYPQGGFPRGYGCEVFGKFELQLANAMATKPYDREHVTPWLMRNTRVKYLENPEGFQCELNYCVDTPEDLERLRNGQGQKQAR